MVFIILIETILINLLEVQNKNEINDDNINILINKINSLKEGIEKIDTSSTNLSNGLQDIKNGSNKIIKGNEALSNGSKKLEKGIQDAYNGTIIRFNKSLTKNNHFGNNRIPLDTLYKVTTIYDGSFHSKR